MNFGELLPDLIFEAVSAQGYRPTGVLFPLNSYENRVYEIGIEGAEPIIGKFYRPGRWSSQAIAEEHAFLAKLVEHEVPVVQALTLEQPIGESVAIGKIGDINYSLFPKFRGREHAEITVEDLRWLGRTLGRLHNIGEHFSSKHRICLNPESYGYPSMELILGLDFLPSELHQSIAAILSQALKLVDPYFQRPWTSIVLHGDCHPGNILWNQDGPHLLDFDDMVIAPPVQDLWMLFNGTSEEKQEQKKAFFEGYEIFRSFEDSSFILSEPLRTLRMIRHTAWIGQRYEEPIFQRSFPYYKDARYWEEFLLSLKEQIALLQEPSY